MSTPPRNPTFADTSLPLWLADAHDRFKNDLRREGAAKSTCTDYPRRAREFVQWCIGTFGVDRAAWPIDAPERWYVVRGWVGQAQGYRNLATSALRSALRWDRGQQPGTGFDIPDLQFPPSVTPPRRKPKTLVPPDGDPNMDQSFATPNGAAAAGITPAPNSTPETTVQPQPANPSSVTPPGYIAPSPDIAPGITDRPLSRPRTVSAQHQKAARNTLGAMLPAGGKLKIYRVSDGTDNAYPGERVLFAEPTERDTRGYNDAAVWIKDFIHDVKEPLKGPRTLNTIYMVEHYDDQERLIGAPRRVTLPNHNGSMTQRDAPMPGVPSAPPLAAGPAPGSMVDEVMKSFIKRAERYDQWQEEQLRLHNEVVEKAQRGDSNAHTQWILNQRPAPVDIKSLVEDVVTRVQDIVNKARDAAPAPAPAPLMLPPPPPAKDPFESPLLRDLVAAVTRQPTPPPAPVTADPVEQFARVAAIIRPPTDPAVTALQARLDTLTNELRDAKMKDPSKDPMNFFTMMKMMDDMVDRRMNRMGGGGGGIGEAIAEGIKALPEVVNALAQNQQMQPRAGRPGAPPPAQPQAPPQQAQPQQQQQRPAPVATPEQLAALRALAESANKNDDTGTLNALLGFIVANGQAPDPWPQLNAELFGAIKEEITTADELGYLVQRIFQLPPFGGGSLVKEFPGVIRKATDILAWNFPVICERLKIAPRDLQGVVGVENAPPVVAKPEAPAPAGDPPGEQEEEEDEEEEETPEPETPAGDPPATDANPAVPPKAATGGA